MIRLAIIDGNNWANRAYFALPDLRSESGERTGAVYGFRNMLKGVLKKSYSHIVACFDEQGPTIRHSMFPDYKANRMLGGKKPDIYRQMDVIREMLGYYGIPWLKYRGYEADDIIHSICELLKEKRGEDISVDIYSADKDLMQLVSDRITVIDTNSKNVREFSKDFVIKHFGVPPRLMADYLAILGDKSDNIPGCDGIGKKGAAEMVASFGSLEQIKEQLYEALALEGKISKKQQLFLDQYHKLVTSRELIYLMKVPQVMEHMSVEDFMKQGGDLESLTKLFSRLSFKT